MSETSPQSADVQWNITAAIAAWVCPGLGHLLLGQIKRGIILMITIGVLWTGGLALGGIDVIDWQQHRFWFLAQMLIAPSLAVNFSHQYLHKVKRHLSPAWTRPSNPAWAGSMNRVRSTPPSPAS